MIILDWTSLNAPEVPHWLVGLMSTDEDRQFQSKLMLSKYLQQHSLALNIAERTYNQVLKTDAVVLITELLVEMLSEDLNIKPLYILELLEIVSSYRKETSLGQIQRERALRIYEIVVSKFNLYLNMLTNSDVDIRVGIINLLGNISEKWVSTANNLIHYLKTKHITEEIEIVSALKIIFETIKSDEHETGQLKLDFIATLNEYINRQKLSKIVLAHASCFLILLQSGQVSHSVLNTLTNILAEAKLMDPSEDLGLSNLWVDAFLSLGIHQATRSLFHIFDYQDDEYMIIYTSAILLNLYFGNGDIHSLHIQVNKGNANEIYAHVTFGRNQIKNLQNREFSDIQKEILKRFVKKDILWEVKTNLFVAFALPVSRSELEHLLEH